MINDDEITKKPNSALLGFFIDEIADAGSSGIANI